MPDGYIGLKQCGEFIDEFIDEFNRRIYSFPSNEIEPSIITIQLHLKNKQTVTFKKNEQRFLYEIYVY